ncbi:transporter substrate-binding domain-containing protein [Paenibacillus sp. FSL H8-0537]|uniref:transporter substrate-binding domain-containing protein n=1 Tax=Paenibacillus sp. FSL H8-0537 TaxID=2921399 RepID=UPI003101B0B5
MFGKKSVVLLMLALTLVLGACGSTTTNDSESASSGGNAESKELNLATFGVSIGFSKKDGDKLEGYDIAVAEAVAKYLGYTKVNWTTADMAGMFGMLDAGKIDTIANQVEANEKRKEKYIFSNTYIYSGAQLIVRADDDSIQSLADLKGKKIGVDVGTSKEAYLRANDPNNELNITTYEDPSVILNDVALKRLDAYIMDRAGAQLLIDNSGLALKKAGDPVYTYEEAFPFPNTEEGKKLRDSFNEALEALAKDGTLTKLSNEHLKQDISKAN